MAPMPAQPRRVAIACQGGGSHTAFTSGVLGRLLGAGVLSDHEVVGLSGTSGGAVCALLAWSAIARGEADRAGELLDAFWADNAATSPVEQAVNASVLWAGVLANVVALPAVSPYATYGAVEALRAFRGMLERRVDFGALEPDPDAALPMLLIGAVDALSGDFVAFNSRRDRITADMVLASAAIPTLFRAVRIGGGTYWDGLFSQNPPVRELLDAAPDEIWVLQINPRRRPTEPRSVTEIADRRNELAGNLSLHQELHFIEKINGLLDRGLLPRDGPYRTVTVRVIELTRSRVSRVLGATSKLNRDPAFIAELIAHGRTRADEFLTALAFENAWRRRDADGVVDLVAADAELWTAPPFGERPPVRGREAVAAFVREQLADDVTIDVSRKQVAGDGVAWTVHAGAVGAAPVRGRAEAVIRDGLVRSFRLGADRP